MRKNKLIIAVTGASGSVYAKILIDSVNQYIDQFDDIALVFSDNARDVWKHELDEFDINSFPFKVYNNIEFNAPFASGSSDYNSMVICPCTMGTMGRIANGISSDLISRAADVILKERRKLILVIRETPFSLIHIENMKKITLSGGIICPAIPSFYSKPKTIEDLSKTVIHRVLDLLGIDIAAFRWNPGKA